jgi:hypothetical protein
MPNIFNLSFTIPLVIFYWAYLVLVVIFLVMSALNIYNLLRFGFLTFTNVAVIIIYIGIAVWLLGYSFNFLGQFDWTVPVFDSSWFNLSNPLN